MKIGVISDTHLSAPDKAIQRVISEVFDGISLILHAGDITHLNVLEAFAGKQVIGVCGNMDHSEVAHTLPKKRIISIEGYRIGLIHGWGSSTGIEDRIQDQFDAVHAIVYGHTHKPANHIKNGILMFNPGAFSGSFPMRRNPSAGILTIDDEGIHGSIIQL